jgi:hypothetical protein
MGIRDVGYLPRSRSDERSSYQDFVLLESREASVLDFTPSLRRRTYLLPRLMMKESLHEDGVCELKG